MSSWPVMDALNLIFGELVHNAGPPKKHKRRFKLEAEWPQGAAGVRPALLIDLFGRARLVLNRLEIVDDRLDVGRAEHEDRHVRMARDNALGERFGDILDRVFAGERPETRRCRMGTIAFFADSVAVRTLLPNDSLAFGGEGPSPRRPRASPPLKAAPKGLTDKDTSCSEAFHPFTNGSKMRRGRGRWVKPPNTEIKRGSCMK